MTLLTTKCLENAANFFDTQNSESNRDFTVRTSSDHKKTSLLYNRLQLSSTSARTFANFKWCTVRKPYEKKTLGHHAILRGFVNTFAVALSVECLNALKA